METRSVRFEFFRILSTNQKFDCAAFSARLAETMPNFDKAIAYGSKYIRKESYTFDGHIHYGVVSRIKMDYLPKKAKLSTPGVSSLGLGDDEGIAGLTSFLFDPILKVIVIQKQADCVSVRALLSLFEHVTGERGLDAAPLILQNALNRLYRMRIIRSWEVKVVSPTTAEEYDDYSAKAAATLAAQYEARTIHIHLGIGNGRGSLNIDAIKNSSLRLLRMLTGERKELKTLRITGKGVDDEKLEILDLINQKLTHSVEIPIKGRELEADALERAVRQAYNERKEELQFYMPV